MGNPAPTNHEFLEKPSIWTNQLKGLGSFNWWTNFPTVNWQLCCVLAKSTFPNVGIDCDINNICASHFWAPTSDHITFNFTIQWSPILSVSVTQWWLMLSDKYIKISGRADGYIITFKLGINNHEENIWYSHTQVELSCPTVSRVI